MPKDSPTPLTEDAISAMIEDPNRLLYRLLEENNLKIDVTALDETNPFIDGKGFVLTERPLLIVTAKYKEPK